MADVETALLYCGGASRGIDVVDVTFSRGGLLGL